MDKPARLSTDSKLQWCLLARHTSVIAEKFVEHSSDATERTKKPLLVLAVICTAEIFAQFNLAGKNARRPLRPFQG
jgi:hypothetical protein